MADQEGLLVFCCPGDAYLECRERDAVDSRARLNEAFDKLVTFSPSYAEFSATPDVVKKVGEKVKRQRVLQAFLMQDLTQIRDIKAPITMSNYLFHLKNPAVPIWESPDLGVVSITGKPAEEAAQIVESFYHSFGWDAVISRERIPHEKAVLRPQSRIYQPTSAKTTILNPHALITTAQRVVCYDPTNLSWREK